MAQADGNVANGSGAAVRSDINTQLGALWTNHSGATEPSTKYAYQFWADTTANELKLRNGANSAWITLRSTTSGGIVFPAGSEADPSLTFATDGPDYGFYRPAAGVVGFVTQFEGADHTLFTIGKDTGATDQDGHQVWSHFSHVSGLPAPGHADLRGRRKQLDVQVPVPPLDLRRGRPFVRRSGNGTN